MGRARFVPSLSGTAGWLIYHPSTVDCLGSLHHQAERLDQSASGGPGVRTCSTARRPLKQVTATVVLLLAPRTCNHRAAIDRSASPGVPAAPSASSLAVRSVMRANSKKDTRPERALRSELQRRGLRFRKHYALASAGRCRADIVFTRARIAVFVDGCFWHGCPDHGTRPRTNSVYWSAKINRNVARDADQTRLLERSGWRVVRIWEHEAVSSAADRVERALRGEA
jgi:DNA mismatch endonuclease, patch repair protein